MASNNLTVSDLDFDKIKSNLKDFMRAQTQFKDYDFEGSSLSILLDLLAYNTHYVSYYANMIANEMYLDTAIIRESVVSKAKMLGYTPYSRTCSEAFLDIKTYINKVVGQSAPNTLQMDSWAQFQSSTATSTYTFLTTEDVILTHDASLDTSDAWVYVKNNVRIIEGTHLTYQYIVQSNNVTDTSSPLIQHFIIPTPSIDLSTLKVSVQNSNSDLTNNVFKYAGELQKITGNDRVYWLHEVSDFRYELKFGDGNNVGVALELANIINLDYISTNGSLANGCKTFTSGDKIYRGWAFPINENSSMICTPSSFRILEVKQSYTANYISGETVIGATTKATGVVETWDEANGVLTLIGVNGVFALNETVTGISSGTTSVINMSSIQVSRSSSGSERESIESIKDLAPKSYLAQDRCVITGDYETIIKNSYPNIRAIKVWGGENMVPPVFGKVFIALRPHIGQILSNGSKERILNNILSSRKILTVQTTIVDPDYIYIIPTCEVKYNPNLTTLAAGNIINLVTASIVSYGDTYLNNFTAPFYYTNMTTNINNVDSCIVSNVLDIKIKKYFDPTLNVLSNNIEIDYSNRLKEYVLDNYGNNITLTSSSFTFRGISGCTFGLSGKNPNIIQVYGIANNKKVVVSGGENVGLIDYNTGRVIIKNITISATELINPTYPEFKGRVAITFIPYEEDLFSYNFQILDILNEDVTVTAIDIRTLLQ